MKIKDVMIPLEDFPVVPETLFFKEALDLMSEKKIGIACIVDDSFKLKGILTDGDIRREFLNVQKPLSAIFVDDCIEHAILSPTVINPESSLLEAIEIMGDKRIWDLPVVDNNGKLIGLLHLHPVVKSLLNNKLK
jgi:CBS domain-containing protein